MEERTEKREGRTPNYGEALTRTAQRIHNEESTADDDCCTATEHDLVQYYHGVAHGLAKANRILQEEYQGEYSGIPVDIEK